MKHNPFDEVMVDNWDDIESVYDETTRALVRVAADRELLRRMVLEVERTPALFSKCERHELDDKIVLYDAMNERGFRVRLRLATSYQDERPHEHRFTFSTLILRGSYRQTLYEALPCPEGGFQVGTLRIATERREPEGSLFTIHHSVIHSTISAVDTISLVLRGPPAKKRAMIALKAHDRIEWREGEGDESAERRETVRMGIDRYREWVTRMTDYGVI